MKSQEALQAANIAAMANVASTIKQIQQSIRSYAPVIAKANKRKRHDKVLFRACTVIHLTMIYQENDGNSPSKSARHMNKVRTILISGIPLIFSFGNAEHGVQSSSRQRKRCCCEATQATDQAKEDRDCLGFAKRWPVSCSCSECASARTSTRICHV